MPSVATKNSAPPSCAVHRGHHACHQPERDPHASQAWNRLPVNFQMSRRIENPPAQAQPTDQRHQRQYAPQRHRKRDCFLHPAYHASADHLVHQPLHVPHSHSPRLLCQPANSRRAKRRPRISEIKPRQSLRHVMVEQSLVTAIVYLRGKPAKTFQNFLPLRRAGDARRSRSRPATPAALPTGSARRSRSTPPLQSVPLSPPRTKHIRKPNCPAHKTKSSAARALSATFRYPLTRCECDAATISNPDFASVSSKRTSSGSGRLVRKHPACTSATQNCAPRFRISRNACRPRPAVAASTPREFSPDRSLAAFAAAQNPTRTPPGPSHTNTSCRSLSRKSRTQRRHSRAFQCSARLLHARIAKIVAMIVRNSHRRA